MMDTTDAPISRRSYIKRMLALTGVALSAGALTACGKQSGGGGSSTQPSAATESSSAAVTQTALDCTDESGLTADQKETRANVDYVDQSPMPTSRCANCAHFIEAKKSNTCGTCRVVPGPINAKGFCTLWTPL